MKAALAPFTADTGIKVVDWGVQRLTRRAWLSRRS
jgi:hypothetical protein